METVNKIGKHLCPISFFELSNHVEWRPMRLSVFFKLVLHICFRSGVVSFALRTNRYRVIISIQNYGRHLLPVPKTCRWWHRNGVPRQEEGCLTVGDRPIENYSDLMSCLREAPCDISGEHLSTNLGCFQRTIRTTFCVWQEILSQQG